MSMDEFVQTLSKEQKEALIKALGGNIEVESRFQHEEPISEAVDGSVNATHQEKKPEEDFTMNRVSSLPSNGRREPVKAGNNTWADTGEFKEVETPDVTRTPRNRRPPEKKKVVCHVCNKTFEINAGLTYGEYYRCDRCIKR